MSRLVLSVFFAAAGMLLFAIPESAVANQLSCESVGYKYRYCRAQTRGHVDLVRQESKTRCVEGRNWGYDPGGIWVDEGCAARFEYGNRGGYGYNHNRSRDYYRNSGYDYDRYHDDDDHGGKGAAAAIAAIGAIAVGAAIANSNKSNRDDYTDHRGRRYVDVPGWARGTFVGYSPVHRERVRLTIRDDGRATVYNRGGTRSGEYHDGKLSLGGSTFDLTREGDGFRAVDRRNRGNVIHYSRG